MLHPLFILFIHQLLTVPTNQGNFLTEKEKTFLKRFCIGYFRGKNVVWFQNDLKEPNKRRRERLPFHRLTHLTRSASINIWTKHK